MWQLQAYRPGLKRKENILSFASVLLLFTGEYMTYGTVSIDKEAIVLLFTKFKDYYNKI